MNLILELVLLIFLGGAYGGTVSGILRDRSYKIQWPGGHKFDMGFIGDALVGGAAAISVFAIAGSLLNIDLTKLNEAGEFLKVLAIAIVSGFGGISVLQNLSDNLLKSIEEKVDQQVERVDQLDEQVELIKLQEQIESIKHQERISEFVRTADFYTDNQKYEEALMFYNQALTIDPKNPKALINKGAVLKRMGKVQEAYDIVNQIIDRDPNHQKAWYNRACYGCLLGHDKADVIRDLQKAISLFPQYKVIAANDQDFSRLINEPEFNSLTED